MNKKLLGFIVLIGISACFFFLFVIMGNTRAERGEKEKFFARPIFISEMAVFKKLERSPVEFYHDKHTVALEKEGCGVCHPQDEKGKFIFKYPRLRDDGTKKSLMNSYHDSCIGCHIETSKKGKKSGFVTCGECHVVKKGQEEWLRPVKLDYYLHYQHEKALEKKCETCHHIYNEGEKRLVYRKGAESSCRDCHREKDVGRIASFRKVAHADCINCHMGRSKEGKKAGPYDCEGCHIEQKQRTTKEVAVVPRPERGQPDRVLISIKDSRMRGVPFDHKGHEAQSLTCRNCHHEKLIACKECHTKNGSPEGGMVNLAKAYHEPLSKRSCVGCHASYKSKPSCAGCHQSTKGDLNDTSCLVCHSGVLHRISPVKITNELLPKKPPDEVVINLLEKEYMQVKFKHFTHVKKLVEISNGNMLANHFHTDKTTICIGCHHHNTIEDEGTTPPCSSCHNISFDLQNLDKPRLIAAYHLQCINCHNRMKLKPLKCTDCHAEKRINKTLSQKNQTIK